MKITWLGQGGFVVESCGKRFVVDPYISTIVEEKQGVTRLLPPPLSVAQLKPDALVCTHNHMDHFDPVAAPEILKTYPGCPLVGPDSVREKAAQFGVDTACFRKIGVGADWSLGQTRIVATPARHSDPQAVGLLFFAPDHTLYISGDTEYDEPLAGQIAKLAGKPIDTALICINGRLGNMNLDDAVRVMIALKPKRALPMHYGLFAENTADPQPFVEKCRAAGMDSFTLTPGVATEL